MCKLISKFCYGNISVSDGGILHSLPQPMCSIFSVHLHLICIWGSLSGLVSGVYLHIDFTVPYFSLTSFLFACVWPLEYNVNTTCI